MTREAKVDPLGVDARAAVKALGLPAEVNVHLPNSVEELAQQLKERVVSDEALDSGLCWSSGQALHRERLRTQDVLCLTRLQKIEVDDDRGVVHAEAGALLVAVEAALRRSGWTLDVSFPRTLRVADALAGGPWSSTLRRRLMSLTWVSLDGRLHEGEAACVRNDEGPRVDRAVPIPRSEAIPCAASFRARPAGGHIRTRWWRVPSLSRATMLAKDAVREGWPHTQAVVEFGRHVALGLNEGALGPVLDASAAALRAKFGGGSPQAADDVLLGLRVRAEFGVGAVLFDALERRMDPDVSPLSEDDVRPDQWHQDLTQSMAAWDLQRDERWREATGDDLMPQERGTRATDASGLRCTRAMLETHGAWLVRETEFVRQPGVTSRILPRLRDAPPRQGTVRATADDTATAAELVRHWRRAKSSTGLFVDVSPQQKVTWNDHGEVLVGVAARLADVERALRDVGHTIGLRPSRLGDTRVLDLLLDTSTWRAAACRCAAHGLRLDPMGAVRAVRGVDRHGSAGELARWLRTDDGDGLHAVPCEARIRGWRWIKRDKIVDWRWTGEPRLAMKLAHEVSRRSPHLLRLAVHRPLGGAEQAQVLLRTGGSRPGQRRAADHVQAVFAGVQRTSAEIWRSAPFTSSAPHVVRVDTPLAEDAPCWLSHFSRGRALRSMLETIDGEELARVAAPAPASCSPLGVLLCP